MVHKTSLSLGLIRMLFICRHNDLYVRDTTMDTNRNEYIVHGQYHTRVFRFPQDSSPAVISPSATAKAAIPEANPGLTALAAARIANQTSMP